MRSLDITDGTQTLSAAVSAAIQLETLSIMLNPDKPPLDTGGLECLTLLTLLSLKQCGLPAPSQGLSFYRRPAGASPSPK
jgi:hypothetical protein